MERKAVEKRRVVVVVTHGGGMEEKCKKNDQNLSSSLIHSNFVQTLTYFIQMVYFK
jgi:hypothetical protein